MAFKFPPPPPTPSGDPAELMRLIQDSARREAVQLVGDTIVRALTAIGYQPSSADKPRDFGVRVPKAVKGKVNYTIRKGSDVAKVLAMIQTNPGKKGFEIDQLLAATGDTVNERTLRTALRRLKVRGFIEQRMDGAWYPTEKEK
jgi:hypothetical protein